MSLEQQHIFSSFTAMSQTEMLQRMMRLQMEIHQLQLLYKQQAQNTFSNEMQQVDCAKIPEDRHKIPVVSQPTPVTDKFMPEVDQETTMFEQSIPKVGQSIRTDFRSKNPSNRLSSPFFVNGSFFRSNSLFNPDRIVNYSNGKKKCVFRKWPVTKFLWWEEKVTAWNMFKRTLWQW